MAAQYKRCAPVLGTLLRRLGHGRHRRPLVSLPVAGTPVATGIASYWP